MIHYIVVDDDERRIKILHKLLQSNIQKEFGAAEGTICSEVNQARSEIKKRGPHFNLFALDMEFYDDIFGGGFKVLEALTPQQRRKVVAYSSHMEKMLHTGRSLSEELGVRFAIPLERAIDMLQGEESLWKACASVLKEGLG